MNSSYINEKNATGNDKFLSSVKEKNKIINNFTLDYYYDLLDKYDLSGTWNMIIKELKEHTVDSLNKTFLKFDDIGELYEIGLAHTNKIEKKELGKYYTPTDVAYIMSELLLENTNIESLVDVACGTGNLIVEVIRQIKEKNLFDIISFIKEGNLYLYDLDGVAIKICIAKIELILGEPLKKYINVTKGDFLNKNVKLPKNSTVITNPPYSLIKTYKKSWFKSEVLEQSRDFYAGFMDKIIDSCKNAVVVSPQSFLVSDKFSILRDKLGSNFYGEIFSFDNVPGTLFNGRKHGIFNTNNANGVRASISSIKRNGHQGFRLSHLIRFKTDQRNDVIKLDFLRSKLGDTVQDLKVPLKVFKELEPFIHQINNSDKVYMSDLLEEDINKQDERYKINVSTSARYFTVATVRDLDRNGVYFVYAKDEKSFKLVYGLLSSSYVYMWWRFFDGGILFSKRWLLRTPVMIETINKTEELITLVDEMIQNESNYLSYKKNAGKAQESVKFPVKYRNKLNKILFKDYHQYFGLLHRNNEVYENASE